VKIKEDANVNIHHDENVDDDDSPSSNTGRHKSNHGKHRIEKGFSGSCTNAINEQQHRWRKKKKKKYWRKKKEKY